jgi:hypothetical protein
MGWENETGRMDYKFFWGRMLSAVAKSEVTKKNSQNSQGVHNNVPPRDETFLCAPRTHAQGATNHKQYIALCASPCSPVVPALTRS